MRLVEITIDVTSPEHPYVQLANKLRQRIAAGEYAAGFPSLWDLVEETRYSDNPERRVSYNTVRRAVKILKDEGLLDPVPGRGTFVRRQA